MCNSCLVQSTPEKQKDTEMCCSLLQILLHILIHFFFWYAGVLYASQALKVARNVKFGICLLILSNVSPIKSY